GQDGHRGSTHRRRGQGRAGGPRAATAATAPAPTLHRARPATLAVALARLAPGAPTTPRPALRTAMALRTRLDHRQRDALPLLVHAHHPDRDHVADTHHVVRALDVAVGQLADVNQARILQPDIDERAEIHDVQDRAFELHAGGQVLE